MKSIITLCLTLFFIAGMQSTQAQTKEETIQWLNDYGKTIDISGYIEEDITAIAYVNFTGYDGEYLNFYIKEYHGKFGNMEKEYTILPKDILFTEVSTLGENPFVLKGKPSSFFFSGRAIGERISFLGGAKTDNSKQSSMFIYFSEKNSKDAQRLIKAIMHLAKLSGADPLPKVTENTF